MAAAALLLSLPVLSVAGQAGPGGEAPASGDELVRVALVADRAAIAPGESFLLGVHLRIEPGWHVYWLNPGDGGLPTRASLRAPEGFELGPLAFPGPRRIDLPGGLVSYGYEQETLLVAAARAPAALEPGAKPRFEVDCSWLVCAEICLPGRGEAMLEIAAGTDATPANQALFERYRARMPRPLGELAGARWSWSGGTEAPLLRIVVPRSARLASAGDPGGAELAVQELEFLPLDGPALTMTGREREDDAQQLALALRYRFLRTPAAAWSACGVLGVRGMLAGVQRELFFAVDAPGGAARE
jgi:DsbC/DsbD-like thiol-disulfide interchange protein